VNSFPRHAKRVAKTFVDGLRTLERFTPRLSDIYFVILRRVMIFWDKRCVNRPSVLCGGFPTTAFYRADLSMYIFRHKEINTINDQLPDIRMTVFPPLLNGL
jgi:hypothetical protein